MDPVSEVAPLKDMEDELNIVGIIFYKEYLSRCIGSS